MTPEPFWIDLHLLGWRGEAQNYRVLLMSSGLGFIKANFWEGVVLGMLRQRFLTGIILLLRTWSRWDPHPAIPSIPRKSELSEAPLVLAWRFHTSNCAAQCFSLNILITIPWDQLGVAAPHGSSI